LILLFFFKQLQLILNQNRTEANALDAAAQGAANAVLMVAHVIANLIAFLAFIAFLNGVISWYGNLLGAPYITFEVFRLYC
jgi:pyrimidine nucleoside transport protein